MDANSPRVTFIIPVRNSQGSCPAVDSIRKLIYPQHLIEILVVAGDNPSVQRNRAASQAGGEVLYFLDNDSELHPRALQVLQFALEDFPNGAGFGGPAVPALKQEGPVEAGIKCVMQSVYAFGPMRKRYFPIGEPRPAGERELILCNFAIKKVVWDRYSGFSVHLYPNEENEFFTRLESAGERFYYHPYLIARRALDLNPFGYIKKMYAYGFSRVRHVKLHGFSGGGLLFAPMCLTLYFLLVLGYQGKSLLTGALGAFQFGELKLSSLLLVLPLIAYASVVLLGVLFSIVSSRNRSPVFAFTVAALIPCTHLAYGLGMLVSLYVPTRLRNFREPSVVPKKVFDAAF